MRPSQLIRFRSDLEVYLSVAEFKYKQNDKIDPVVEQGFKDLKKAIELLNSGYTAAKEYIYNDN